MKKLLFLLVAVSVAFTGCWKDDDSYKVWDPVKKGIEIYQFTLSQHNVAMQPADLGVRFALLFAEAEKQDIDNFNDVLVNKSSVKTKLFGSNCTISYEGNGRYKLLFTDNGYIDNQSVCKGAAYVQTHDVELKNTNPTLWWTVELDPEFTVTHYSAGSKSIIRYKNGETRLYNNGVGTYVLAPSGIVACFDGTSVESNWSGSFTLKPASEGFAYSDCVGKEFVFAGNAEGPSIYADGTSSVGMSYRITDGKYIYFGVLISGEEICALTSNYDMTYYFENEVTVEVGLKEDGKTQWRKVIYGDKMVLK